jgi:hypothetical protein
LEHLVFLLNTIEEEIDLLAKDSLIQKERQNTQQQNLKPTIRRGLISSLLNHDVNGEFSNDEAEQRNKLRIANALSQIRLTAKKFKSS